MKTASEQVIPGPARIVKKLKLGLTAELRDQLVVYASLARQHQTNLIREILETELPRRIARLEARRTRAAA